MADASVRSYRAFSAGSHNDQSRSAASGEMPVSFPGAHSAEQKYSIVDFSSMQAQWAKPGGSQIQSPNAASGDAGRS